MATTIAWSGLGAKPIKPYALYRVVLKTSTAAKPSYDQVVRAQPMYIADPTNPYYGSLNTVYLCNDSEAYSLTNPNLKWAICQYYTNAKYDVYYSENKDVDEVAFVHGSVYTVPKVEPKQWRTITTEGTTVTYGDWKLLSQATPQGVEGTNYEYMKEACVVRHVTSPQDLCSVFVLSWSGSDESKVNIEIYEVASADHAPVDFNSATGDRVVPNFDVPAIDDNFVSYNHEDGETSTNTVAIKTRRIDRA